MGSCLHIKLHHFRQVWASELRKRWGLLTACFCRLLTRKSILGNRGKCEQGDDYNTLRSFTQMTNGCFTSQQGELMWKNTRCHVSLKHTERAFLGAKSKDKSGIRSESVQRWRVSLLMQVDSVTLANNMTLHSSAADLPAHEAAFWPWCT